MQILNVLMNQNQNKPALSFGDCAIREVGDKLITHFTHIKRYPGINRDMLTLATRDLMVSDKGCEYLFCGCSDASEVFDEFMFLAYAFFMNGIPFSYLPKFKAFDSSEQMINIAKTGRINISNAGINYIKSTYPKFNFFIKEGDVIHHEGEDIKELERAIGSKVEHSYQFQPDLLKRIEFYVGDMLQEFSKITSDICRIIFCRSAARYNSDDYQQKAATFLNQNLRADSLVFVGTYDEHNILDKDGNVVESLRKNPNTAPRIPFAECLHNGNFVYDETISSENLVYKKY